MPTFKFFFITWIGLFFLTDVFLQVNGEEPLEAGAPRKITDKEQLLTELSVINESFYEENFLKDNDNKSTEEMSDQSMKEESAEGTSISNEKESIENEKPLSETRSVKGKTICDEKESIKIKNRIINGEAMGGKVVCDEEKEEELSDKERNLNENDVENVVDELIKHEHITNEEKEALKEPLKKITKYVAEGGDDPKVIAKELKAISHNRTRYIQRVSISKVKSIIKKIMEKKQFKG